MTTTTTPPFMTLIAFAKELGVGPEKVREAIARGVVVKGEVAVINHGTERMPRWHFDRELRVAWWKEYGACPAASESGEASGRSDGATPTASSARARARRSARRKSSNAKSTPPSRLGAGGSLQAHVRERLSRTR